MGYEKVRKGTLAPVVTPYCDDGSVNCGEYKKLINYITANGVSGILVSGTSGEFANLTVEEREELLLAAQEGAASGTDIIFNITALNLRDIDRLIQFAGCHGINKVSVTAPYYHKYDEQTLIRYFQIISEHVGDMSLYLYNMSGLTQNPISAGVLKNVVERCGNVRGIKDSSMNFETILQYQLVVDDPDFQIITGNDAQLLPVLQAGGDGGIIVTAGVFPKLASSIYRHFIAGDLDAARKAQQQVMRIRDTLRSVMPVMAYKGVLELQGFHMGPARFPFRDLTKHELNFIEESIKKLV